jgi:hypothetical protein
MQLLHTDLYIYGVNLRLKSLFNLTTEDWKKSGSNQKDPDPQHRI